MLQLNALLQHTQLRLRSWTGNQQFHPQPNLASATSAAYCSAKPSKATQRRVQQCKAREATELLSLQDYPNTAFIGVGSSTQAYLYMGIVYSRSVLLKTTLCLRRKRYYFSGLKDYHLYPVATLSRLMANTLCCTILRSTLL